MENITIEGNQIHAWIAIMLCLCACLWNGRTITYCYYTDAAYVIDVYVVILWLRQKLSIIFSFWRMTNFFQWLNNYRKRLNECCLVCDFIRPLRFRLAKRYQARHISDFCTFLAHYALARLPFVCSLSFMLHVSVCGFTVCFCAATDEPQHALNEIYTTFDRVQMSSLVCVSMFESVCVRAIIVSYAENLMERKCMELLLLPLLQAMYKL